MISAAYSSRLHLMCLSMFNQREVPWACVRHSTFKKKFGQNLHCRAGSEIKYPHLGVILQRLALQLSIHFRRGIISCCQWIGNIRIPMLDCQSKNSKIHTISTSEEFNQNILKVIAKQLIYSLKTSAYLQNTYVLLHGDHTDEHVMM